MCQDYQRGVHWSGAKCGSGLSPDAVRLDLWALFSGQVYGMPTILGEDYLVRSSRLGNGRQVRDHGFYNRHLSHEASMQALDDTVDTGSLVFKRRPLGDPCQVIRDCQRALVRQPQRALCDPADLLRSRQSQHRHSRASYLQPVEIQVWVVLKNGFGRSSSAREDEAGCSILGGSLNAKHPASPSLSHDGTCTAVPRHGP